MSHRLLEDLRTRFPGPVPDALHALGVSRLASEPDRRRLAADGFWWLDPWLFEDAGDAIGFLAHPNLPEDRMPAIVAHGIQSMTVSSLPACIVPMRVFGHSLFNLPAGWRWLRSVWDRTAPQLKALHHALGGSDELETLERVLLSDAVREAVVYRSGDAGLVERAAGRIFRMLDQDAGHLRYRDHVDALIDRSLPGIEDFTPFGAWRNAAAAASVVVGTRSRSSCEATLLRACWEVLCGPAGLDTCVVARARHSARLGDVPVADQVVLTAARRLASRRESCPAAWQADPLFEASLALVREAQTYDGSAHVAAAQRLDEAGSPERAFIALQSASFWSRCAAGVASLGIETAARALAARLTPSG